MKTTKEAAKKLNVSIRRIQAMLCQDMNPDRRVTHFKGAIKFGRSWMIPESAIEECCLKLAKKGK